MKKVILFVLCVLTISMMFVFTGCEVTQESGEETTSAQTDEANEQASAQTDGVTEQASASAEDSSLLDTVAELFAPSDYMTLKGDEPAPTTKKSIKVGVVPPVAGVYHTTFKVGFEEGIAALPEGYDIELIYQMPTSTGNQTTTEMIDIMENWINQGIDVIVTCPVADDAALESVFKSAVESGIPVFEYGIDPEMVANDYVTCLVSYYERASAKTVGAWAAETYKDMDLKIAFIGGPEGPYTTLRGDGFLEGIASHPSYEVVAKQSGEWDRETSYNVMQNLLVSNPEINMIFGMYDDMSLGAASAIREAGLEDDIIVLGYDTNIEGLGAVREGTMQCTVYNGTKETGQYIVNLIKEYVMDGIQIEKLYEFVPECINVDNADDFDENRLKID
ncbi:MAG: sugar ABC transporter substrate-binding protein [Eubacteriales bacterium]|nr:sugar ABC transporter substrate-binding protein [Eubacteriales bacterium]